jgi:hypothetical protein
LVDFYKHKKALDGHLNKCKDCTKKDVKNNQEKVGSAYDRTEKGIIRVIYKTQVRNQRLRGFGCIPYSKDELSEWLYKNGFRDLYLNWVDSGYLKDSKPSIDRLDDNIGYCFKNIRLTTWLNNRLHQYRDIKNAEGTGGKRCKTLAKIDARGEIICTYVSYSSAVRDIGYSLEYQIKKSISCRSGFFWKYI